VTVGIAMAAQPVVVKKEEEEVLQQRSYTSTE